MVRRFAGALLVLLAAGCQPAADQPAATAGPGLSPNDQLILASARAAMPPEDFDVSTLPDAESADAKLMMSFCGQCHAVASPGTHSAVEWPVVVRRMWLRMEMLPESLSIRVPEVGERVRITSYLTANALKVSPENLPPGNGQAAFVEVCSRCHALPDPRIHTAKDWPAVFLRMEGNIQRMKVRGPTQEQTGQILTYLQEVAGR
jgi:cytochrome c553